KSAQIREILISESAWEEMTCLFAPSLEVIFFAGQCDERCLFLQGPLFILLITWRGTGRFFTRIGL
ncbi:hypothetical protein C5X64_013620, partial [Klebsiella pneumoniae subsp. pneumoniae]